MAKVRIGLFPGDVPVHDSELVATYLMITSTYQDFPSTIEWETH